MVPFSKFVYKFETKDNELYFRLISHYFQNLLAVWMTTSNDTENPITYDGHLGRRTGPKYDELVTTYDTHFKDHQQTYQRLVVCTKSMWSHSILTYAFEPIHEKFLNEVVANAGPLKNQIVDCILNLMEERKVNTGDVFIKFNFCEQIPADKLTAYFSAALLKFSGVKYGFYVPSSNSIYSYVGGTGFIKVSLTKVTDITCPALDIDDGFLNNPGVDQEEREPEWDIAFQNWVNSGKQENYILKFNPFPNM